MKSNEEDLLALANKIAREPEQDAPVAPRRPAAVPRVRPSYLPQTKPASAPNPAATPIGKYVLAGVFLLAAGLFAAYTLMPRAPDPSPLEGESKDPRTASTQNPGGGNNFGPRPGASGGNTASSSRAQESRLRPDNYFDNLGL